MLLSVEGEKEEGIIIYIYLERERVVYAFVSIKHFKKDTQ